MKPIDFIIANFFFIICSANDSYKENLVINNLNDAIAFNFDFQTTTSDLMSNNYHLFPKAISEIVKKYSISEMHLAMSKGFWNTNKWGLPPVSLPSESAELWAWFDSKEKEIDNKWEHLSHALSGLFCTSLNKLASKKEVIAPNWAYNPEGLTSPLRNNSFIRKSVLSGETICTENLTPWIKLLPCKKLAGLAQLLKPSRLFSSHFTSITISVKNICLTKLCDTIGRLIHQTITLVLDRKIFGNYQNTWSLSDFLNTDVRIERCSLADTSRIYVHGFGSISSLTMVPTGIIGPGKIAYYDLTEFNSSNDKINLKIAGDWPTYRQANHLVDSCPITFTKFATGTGKIRGGIRSIVTSSSDRSIRAIYLDSLPWYFQFLYSSLRIHVNSSTIDPYKIQYIPSLTRERMTHLELIIDIPPYSTVNIEYEFKKLLQNWNEFPPDANHEFYIEASSLTFQFAGAKQGFNNSLLDIVEWTDIAPPNIDRRYKMIRLHSEVVLVSLPSPDFSMPFNALCLACTVIAIMIGGLHRYTTSSIQAIDPKTRGVRGQILKVVNFFRKKFAKKIAHIEESDSKHESKIHKE